MTYTAHPIPIGARLIDCVSALSQANCEALKAAGVDGIIRYFETLSPAEIHWALDADLGVCIVGYARAPRKWTPSAQLGDFDAAAALSKTAALASAVGFDPAGLVQWLDLEGCAGTVEQTLAYVGAFADRVVEIGKQAAGLYVGDGQPLTGAQLYSVPKLTHYWKSFSRVPEVVCGWQMVQLYKSTTVAGIPVDINFAQHDWLDRSATWLHAS